MCDDAVSMAGWLEADPDSIKAGEVAGWTPLHVASMAASCGVVRALVRSSIGKELLTAEVDGTGWKPIHYAALAGSYEAVMAIRSRSPKAFFATTRSGRSVAHLAGLAGNARIVELCKEMRLSIDAPDEAGRSALDYLEQRIGLLAPRSSVSAQLDDTLDELPAGEVADPPVITEYFVAGYPGLQPQVSRVTFAAWADGVALFDVASLLDEPRYVLGRLPPNEPYVTARDVIAAGFASIHGKTYAGMHKSIIRRIVRQGGEVYVAAFDGTEIPLSALHLECDHPRAWFRLVWDRTDTLIAAIRSSPAGRSVEPGDVGWVWRGYDFQQPYRTPWLKSER